MNRASTKRESLRPQEARVARRTSFLDLANKPVEQIPDETLGHAASQNASADAKESSLALATSSKREPRKPRSYDRKSMHKRGGGSPTIAIPKPSKSTVLVICLSLALLAAIVVFVMLVKDSQASASEPGTELAATEQLVDFDALAKAAEDARYPSYHASQVKATVRGEFVVEGNIDASDERLREVGNLLDSYSGNISLVIWLCNGKGSISYNSTGTYFSACTIKAPYIYWVCQQIDAGNGSLDEVMIYEERYYHGGSGTIRETDFGTAYTIGDLIYLALSISDNVAYKMLLGRYGYSGYNNWCASQGLTSIMTDGMWATAETAIDQAAAWELIYQYIQSGKGCSAAFDEATWNSEWAYAVETLYQDFNHKSGYLEDCACNDCGIVWTETPFVFAVLTEDGANDSLWTMHAIMAKIAAVLA